MASKSAKLQNTFDFEEVAKHILSDSHFGYYASGATDEITLKKNIEGFRQIEVLPRVLVDVAKVNTETTIFGQKVKIPILVAPMAVQKIAHPDGENATALACAKHGIIMTLSSISSVSIEEVAKTMQSELVDDFGGLWFQLYILKRREVTEAMVRRAEQSGYKAICLTVDNVEAGKREINFRLFFNYPQGVMPENFIELFHQEKQKTSETNMNEFMVSLYDKTITWEDLKWLKSITTLPIILKGIMHPADAKIAVDAGIDGIIVSNHGGRQLDTSPSTISCLPHIIEAVKGSNVKVFLDGGIRRGTDILKALALGAHAVLIGRPVLWGLAIEGKNGVDAVLKILTDEFVNAMRLCGCTDLESINRTHIAPSNWARL